MKASQTSLLIPGGLLSATLLAVRLVCFPATAAQPTKTIAQAVQPFVDGNTLAGAVMLVESKDIINPVVLKPSSLLAFWALVIDARRSRCCC